MTKKTGILLMLCALTAGQAFGADISPMTPTSMALESKPERREYLLADWQINPLMGMVAITSQAALNVGATAAYQLFAGEDVYFEPSLNLLFLDRTVFEFGAGLRYDIDINDKLRPFVKATMGPAFQTAGDTTVFSAFAAFGAIYPVHRDVDFRAEVGLLALDGDAGFQALAGVGF